MANSTGSLELQGLEQTVFPEHMEHPMPSTAQTNQLEEKGQNKRKVNKPDSRATKRSKKNDTQRIDGSPDYAGANNEQSPLPAPPHISLRDLMEAETKLVFGDEQDITHKSLASTATQLMCQAAEIGGPPSGPNLSFLPQIDKWLDVALQDANSYYQQKKYATAASRFTAALELCSKGTVFEKPFNADYEDICKAASFIESKIVTCYLRKKWPNPALLHSHRSIQLNPICFQNHLGQAMVYRLLGNPCEAASNFQGLLEVAHTLEKNFSVMFTPWFGKPFSNTIEKVEAAFQKLKSSLYRLHLYCAGIQEWYWLLALMAETMDTLEGKRSDQERVWNAMQKVAAVKEMLYQLEETYLKKKALRATKQKKALKKTSLRNPAAPPQGQSNAVADPQPHHPISEHLPPPHKHLSSARK
ncbi:spermatogenesis-associated protein 16-like [Cyprinus carpio]|uniref:Spermatogenesis-associated protein 16-like n=1 Tax=Cyprinus carpio TaxID=7962 RepID=A0A9R0B407_CYPCA|nr:spermatogenesis-associated protein 16-like [Cyprinus carpio]